MLPVRLLYLFLSLLFWQKGHTAYGNYRNVMLGDRAAGMGGAFTALTNDPAAVPYYNPASVVRMKGSSLSAAVNVYHKYDTKFGNETSVGDAVGRVNRGTFRTIPSSSGSILSYGTFAFGLSILVPDYDFYAGQLENDSNSSSYISYLDESLWVGPTFAMNLTDDSSFGLTFYYTARSFQKTRLDEVVVSGSPNRIISSSEENIMTNNSVVFILGYYKKWTNWSFGLSLQPPSLEISGEGYFFNSNIDSDNTSAYSPTSKDKLQTDSPIPPRIGLGLAYEQPKKKTYSLDIVYHGPEDYYEYEKETFSTRIIHQPIVNIALGMEYYIKHYLSIRTGLYTNFSPHPDLVDKPAERQPDKVDMWGFSANVAFAKSEKMSFTFGGYYTGGKGKSSQYINQQYRIIDKSQRIFSMLIGTNYFF